MTVTRLWLVRHGETEWSATGRHTGRTDLPLTPAGEAAARAVGRRLAGQHFDVVLTSPLQRARQTCALAGLGAAARVCDELAEWDYGGYEGRRTAEIRQGRPGWSLWRDGVPPGDTPGEDAAAVGARADAFLAVVAGLSGDVAAFAHGHVLRVIAARWVGLAPADGRLFALSTAAVSILGFEHDTQVLRLWNDTRHLDGAAP